MKDVKKVAVKVQAKPAKKTDKEAKVKVSRAKLFEYVGPQELTPAQKRGQYGMLLRAIMGSKEPVTKHAWADLFTKTGGKTVQDAERIVNWYLKRAVSEKLVAEVNL